MEVTAILQLAAAETALADEPDPNLDQIVVRARRREETLSEVPIAATVFKGAELEQQGIGTFQQLGILSPGLHIASTILIDSIFLRGVGSSPNDPGFEQQMGLFVDGIYLGNGRWISSALFDAQAVQVLAGPQGVYFGKNTTAGAIDIATRNPGSSFEASVKGGYEFNASERYAEAVISGPLSSTVGARLSGRVSGMSGWATNDVTHTGEPGAEDAVGRLTLTWAPTPDFDSNLKLQAQNYNDNGPTARTILLHCAGADNTAAPLTLQGLPVWGATSGTASCARNFRIPGPQQLREGRASSHVPAHRSALALRWKRNSGELISTTGYSHYAFNSYSVANASSLDAVELRTRAKSTAVSTELRYQTLKQSPVNFMLGGYYGSNDFRNFEAPAILPPAFQGAQSTFEQGSSTRSHTQSYFLQLLWDITRAWELDVGARYTRERKRSKFDTLSVAPNVIAFFPPLHFTAGQEFTDLSPQATLTWRPRAGFMAYAAYKEGFLSGGFAHAQLPSPSSREEDFLFGPEEVRGVELGTKLARADRRLLLDVVAYYYDYDGLQVSTFQPASLTFAVENAGRSKSRGVELRSLWRITNAVSLNTDVTHGSTRYTRYIGACLPGATFATGCNVPLPGGGFAQDFNGSRTSFSPDWTARVAIEHGRALSADLSLTLAGGLNYSDNYTVGDVLHQPAWMQYDGRVAVSGPVWKVALIGNNLSNEAVCDQAAARPLGGLGETSCWLDRGREVRLEISAEF
jgi:outer membrane receptor protein involved in Fe transport